MTISDLAKLLETARDLNDPVTDSDDEYVRGQVNLICDMSGVAFAADLIGPAVTGYITHRSDSLADVLSVIERNRRLA